MLYRCARVPRSVTCVPCMGEERDAGTGGWDTWRLGESGRRGGRALWVRLARGRACAQSAPCIRGQGAHAYCVTWVGTRASEARHLREDVRLSRLLSRLERGHGFGELQGPMRKDWGLRV